MITKTCTVCHKELPATLEYFFKERRGKYGLRSKCKVCFAAAAKILKAKPAYREKAIEHGREYYQKNKDQFSKRWRKYYEENAEHLKEKAKEWGRDNLDKRRIIDARRREDAGFRLSQNISRSMRQSLSNGKNGYHWEVLVGYTLDDLIKHIENQFQDSMTWNNYGEWHIDHVIPKSVFNFTKPEHIDFKRCWSLDNLQPLWAEDNMSKGAKLEKSFQPALPI